jgi:hypothetical protein
MDRHGMVSVQSPSPGNLILVPDRHVGVGTASPQELLDVYGDLAVTGGLTIGSRLSTRACDLAAEGMVTAPIDSAGRTAELRSFFVCTSGSWVPVGEVASQDHVARRCNQHPHWGLASEFEMFVMNPETGAPEKIDCHSGEHASSRPYLVLNGDNVTTLSIGATYSELSARLFDSDTTVAREITNAQVTATSRVPINTNVSGVYYVLYTAADQFGHPADPLVRVVRVVDPSPLPEASNVGVSCSSILAANSSATDGVYWVDPMRSGEPFQVTCDMTGGGWFVLKLANGYSDDAAYDASFDTFRVAMWQWKQRDPWRKCADDAAFAYRQNSAPNDRGVVRGMPTETSILPIQWRREDEQGTPRYRETLDMSYPIRYADATPNVGLRSWVQLNAIRSVISELAPNSRIVATVSFVHFETVVMFSIEADTRCLCMADV